MSDLPGFPVLSAHERADLQALADGGLITHGTGNRLMELGLAHFLPFSGWQITWGGTLWLEHDESA